MSAVTALLVAAPTAVVTVVPPATAAPPATVTPPAPSATVQWHPCHGAALQKAGAQCGYVQVPLDYAAPQGAKVSLAVSRVRHTVPASQYQGVMLVNPGGPGEPGHSLSTVGASMPGGSGAAYDWIGFDPRGVGRSKPSLTCRPNYFHADRPPYVPTSQRLIQRWLARSEYYARGCARFGALLQHMTTEEAARDMDRIRAALGARRINYYGWSYGTYLGQVYATLFPQHVRRMVLDSNVDPRSVWYRGGVKQTLAFERVVTRFFGWVARHHRTYHLGRTEAAVERLYYRQLDVLRRHPAAGKIGPAEWTDVFTLAGYLQDIWPFLGAAFSSWVHDGKARLLVLGWRFIDTPGDDNSFAAFNAVTCTDAPLPKSPRRWVRDSRLLYHKAPFLTWASTWFSAPCLYWPAPTHTPVTVSGNHVRALLVDQTLDAATPYQGSLEVRSLFPSSRLVAVRGGVSHAVTPFGSPPCVNRRIAAFLGSGDLPARRPGRRADVVCPKPPEPQPVTSAGRKGIARLVPQPVQQAAPQWGLPGLASR